jgi:hypothetical protein
MTRTEIAIDGPRTRNCPNSRAEWSPLARAFLDVLAERPWPRRDAKAIAVG